MACYSLEHSFDHVSAHHSPSMRSLHAPHNCRVYLSCKWPPCCGAGLSPATNCRTTGRDRAPQLKSRVAGPASTALPAGTQPLAAPRCTPGTTSSSTQHQLLANGAGKYLLVTAVCYSRFMTLLWSDMCALCLMPESCQQRLRLPVHAPLSCNVLGWVGRAKALC